VTGVRAYNVNDALRAHNSRLLKYVEDGGTLVVQYNWPMRDGPRGGDPGFPYAPYPLWISSSERITVEDSPMRILDPASPVFTSPNRITAADFDGWIQERGAYFAERWDPRYTPLLSGGDPGETP